MPGYAASYGRAPRIVSASQGSSPHYPSMNEAVRAAVWPAAAVLARSGRMPAIVCA